MNIFLHELKAYRKSTIIWTLSLSALVLVFMSLFPSISKEIDEFKKVMEAFPEPVRQALGIEINTMGTILGFYSYTFVYLTLCGTIQAMIIGVSIISKEVREKTADFLLTKPVTRSKIVTSKILAAIVSLLITNVIFIAVASLVASQVKTEDYSVTLFFMISITLLFMQLIFLALGIVISVVFPKIKSVMAVSLGTVFSFFFIGMFASTTGEGAKRYLSPFKYFDTASIIENGSYEISFIIAGITIIIVSLVVSYIIYAKKDIHGV